MSSPSSTPEMQSPESLLSLSEFIRSALSLLPSGQDITSPESSPSLEEFIRSQASPPSTLHPSVVVGLAAAPPENQQSGENSEAQRLVIMTILTGANSESRMRGLFNKDVTLPASKASIEAMPVVKITEEGAECSICLTEYEEGGEAKEMPCKHRYHSGCIEKWLSIQGSCPVCRYKLPVEEKTGGGEDDGDTAVEGFMVHISQIVGRRSNSRLGSESDS